ncbi:MAG: hypothetical protein ABIQ39_04115, partial [Ilumatobacteraceae bacterium]
VTRMPRTSNGETELVTHEGAVYRPRTFDGARGYSSARLLLDELREQYDYEGWSAIEKSATAIFDSMLLAFSNAGTHRSVVLRDVRDIAHESVDNPEAQWFVAEWSAPQDAPLDDPAAFAQANPSAGYLPGMTIAGLMQTAAEAKNKSVERIEVLCQWVTQGVEPHVEPSEWKSLQVAPTDLVIPKGARTVWAVDTSHDRSTTWVAAAVVTEGGVPLVTVRTKRPGIIWAVEYLKELAEKSGNREVAVQSKGCPAAELVKPLKLAGLSVHEMDGAMCAIATGRIKDRVRDKQLVVTAQPDVDLAVEGGLAIKYAENQIWSREKSKPVDIAGLCAETWALYALEVLKPAAKFVMPALNTVAVVSESVSSASEPDLASIHF